MHSRRGIEEVAAKAKPSEFPSGLIAISLIFGFAFMLVAEQFASHRHHQTHSRTSNAYGLAAFSPTNTISGDAELDLELNLASEPPKPLASAMPLTLGLVIHCFADGFALGAASLSSATATDKDSHAAELSLVVFFALLVHKGKLYRVTS
jgi:zinc transporter 9